MAKNQLKQTADLKPRRWLVFGEYGLTSPSPIWWRILRNDDRGAFAISDGILCVKAFDSASEQWPTGNNRWRDSVLRHWLNSAAKANEVDFGPHPPPTEKHTYIPEHWTETSPEEHAYAAEKGFLAYFSRVEVDAMAVTKVKSAQHARTNKKDTTEDRVFLVSCDEMEELVGPVYRSYAAFLTEQAQQDLDADPDWGWWLREPSYTGFSDDVAVVEMEEGGHHGFWDAAAPAPGVRPAFVLRPGLQFEGSGTQKNPYRLCG